MPRRPPRPAGPHVAIFPLHRTHLADTSAWSKARNDAAMAAAFDQAARDGMIATCDLVALELLRSAQDHRRFLRQAELLGHLPEVPLGDEQIERARSVQAALSARGQHRGVKPPDLLIAAAAENAEVPVLHYDHDYDLIAEVTGQQAFWVAPPGQLP